jgi:uncharacterized protein
MGQAEQDAALLHACHAGDLEGVRRLVEGGADVNCPGKHQMTPLIAAFGHLEVLRYLLTQGAEVNYTGFGEGSALMLAAYSGDLPQVELYLEHGADPNLSMPTGGETALHMAAVKAQNSVMTRLLSAGADPNRHAATDQNTDMFNGGVKVWGETPLHYAAAYGDVEMLRALLNANADPSAENAHGEKPLAYAGRHMRPREILDLLAEPR